MNAKSVTAIIVFALTWANVVLDAFGIQAIDIDNEGLYTTVSVIMALASAVYNIWHNFNFSDAAKIAQEFLNAIKNGDLNQLAEVFADAHEFVKEYQELKNDIINETEVPDADTVTDAQEAADTQETVKDE